jgi:4-hydroxybenzoyl-CoA thioesterase
VSAPFRVSLPLRFAHCDPAGIAYYPRLFELCDAAVEDWTAAVLPAPRRDMHEQLGLGLPSVDLRAEFVAPSRLGDLLSFAVAVERLGRSSIDLRIDASCGGEPRFSISCRQVLMRLASGRSEPWPAPWRARIEEFVR